MLKLSAIDLDHGIRVSKENICCGFDRVFQSQWDLKQHRADRSVGLIHSRQEQLIQTAHTANRILLTDNEGRKLLVKFLGLRTFDSRIRKKLFATCCVRISATMTFSPFVNQIKGFILRRLTGNDSPPGHVCNAESVSASAKTEALAISLE